MPAELLLLPSPLLPAIAYAPLAQALTQRGWRCRVLSAASATDPHRLIEQWSREASSTSSFVAHSNAGYLAPTVRTKAGSAGPIVFMDAALPPAAGDTALAPPGLREFLASMTDETGLLPPWTHWWPAEDLRRTIPAEWIDTIDAACPRLPLAYFDSRIPAPPGWTRHGNGYLAFGSTYDDERTAAGMYGWPTKTLLGSHLAFLWDLDLVVDSVAEMLAATATWNSSG